MRGSERMILLPALDLLDHRLSDEVSDPVEVVVGIDNPYQVFVVAPFDPPCYRHLGEETLPGVWAMEQSQTLHQPEKGLIGCAHSLRKVRWNAGQLSGCFRSGRGGVLPSVPDTVCAISHVLGKAGTRARRARAPGVGAEVGDPSDTRRSPADPSGGARVDRVAPSTAPKNLRFSIRGGRKNDSFRGAFGSPVSGRFLSGRLRGHGAESGQESLDA